MSAQHDAATAETDQIPTGSEVSAAAGSRQSFCLENEMIGGNRRQQNERQVSWRGGGSSALTSCFWFQLKLQGKLISAAEGFQADDDDDDDSIYLVIHHNK